MGRQVENLLNWFKDNIKNLSTRVLETLVRIVYTIPLAEDWKEVGRAGGLIRWEIGKDVEDGVYEVYVQTDDIGIAINGLAVASNDFTILQYWCPAMINAQWVISNIDPATGDVSGSFSSVSCTCPQGWILSSGDVITTSGAVSADFVVRYRRIA